jgi:hypothetical protein
LTKSGKLQSEDSHFWVSQPRIILNNEQCEGYPNCLSWGCRLQASSYTSFSSRQLGAEASSWKHLATHVRLRWTQKGRRFPRARGNKMVIGPRKESKFRRLEPIKNKRGHKERLEIKFEKNNTEWALGGWDLPEEPSLGSPFEYLSLKDWWTRVWIWTKTPTVWRRKERVLNGLV